jgi:hypothetical protein
VVVGQGLLNQAFPERRPPFKQCIEAFCGTAAARPRAGRLMPWLLPMRVPSTARGKMPPSIDCKSSGSEPCAVHVARTADESVPLFPLRCGLWSHLQVSTRKILGQVAEFPCSLCFVIPVLSPFPFSCLSFQFFILFFSFPPPAKLILIRIPPYSPRLPKIKKHTCPQRDLNP